MANRSVKELLAEAVAERSLGKAFAAAAWLEAHGWPAEAQALRSLASTGAWSDADAKVNRSA